MAQMAIDAENKGQGQNLGKTQTETEVDTDNVEAPESPKGGEI